MKSLKACVVILLCGVTLGYLALVGVFLLPADAMLAHAEESVSIFEEEGDYPRIGLYVNSDLDNWTDALMLETACYGGPESAMEKAVFAYRLTNGIDDPPRWSFILIHGSPEGMAAAFRNEGYSRYWHGYLVFLRPLLALFNYAGIRLVNAVCLSLLFVVLAALMAKRAPVCLLPFLLTSRFFVPEAVAQSLQYSSMQYLVLLSLTALLLFYERMQRTGRFIPFFFLIGLVAAYLDLLTAPTITLTMPLCLLCVLSNGAPMPLAKRLRLLLLCSIAWAAGYACMWGSKWLIVALVQGKDAFQSSVLNAIGLRLSPSKLGEKATRIGTLLRNIRRCFLDPKPTVVFFAYAAILTAAVVRSKRRFAAVLADGLPYIGICLIPVFWIFVLCNHSAVHVFFTFRGIAPIVFCVLMGLKAAARGQEPLPQITETDAAMPRPSSPSIHSVLTG